MLEDDDSKREHRRVQAQVSVRYSSMDEVVVAYSKDLSQGGMFLATEEFLPVNAVMQVKLELPNGPQLPVICRVAYIRDQASASADKPAGMGLEFLDLNAEKLGEIEKYIAAGLISPPSDTGPTRSLNVVVVDDNDSYRELAAGIFRDRGDNVRIARDGLEGLGLCLKEPPDIILSDVQMPRMDGWNFLRMVRSRPTLQGVPFIFLTTLGGDSERLRGYQLGVDDYVSKPYRPEEVRYRAERLVTRAEIARRNNVERKSLRGDLEQVALPSVLSFLEMEKKTGVLLLVSISTARIYLRDGRPLRCEVEDAGEGKTSTELIYDTLGWSHGSFEFAAQEVVCTDEIQSSLTGLLLEHARLGDEENR